MKHSIDIGNDYIAIEENLNLKNIEIEIYNNSIQDSCFIRLDINQLHSFIGTLLHVQQKIKNF